MSLRDQFATDLENVIANDLPERVKVGNTTCNNCLVEDLIGAERDELGGPQLIGNTRIHFQVSEIGSVPLGALVTLLDRSSLAQIVRTTSLSPDKNHIIVTVGDP